MNTHLTRAQALDLLKKYNKEPFHILHALTVEAVMRQLAKEHMTMVVVTHEMGFAREVATRVMFMEGGNFVEENEPKEFFENPKNERLKAFLSKVL